MVKMVLGSSDSQSTSVGTLIDNHTNGLAQLISALGTFEGAEALKGKAYQSAKDYSSSVLQPLAQGAILLAEALKTDVSHLPSRYRSEVGDEDLDEDLLIGEIDTLTTTIDSYASTISMLSAVENPTPQQERDKSSAETAKADAQIKRTEFQTKLQKLQAFNSTSPTIFDALASLESAVSQGLNQMNSDFETFDGKRFKVPKGSKMAWATTISTAWKTYVETSSTGQKVAISSLDADSKAVIQKAEEAYQKGEIDDETYQSIKSGIINFGASYVKELIQTKLTDKVVEVFTESALEWFTHNINATQIGRSAALVGGGTATIATDYNSIWAQLARGAVKNGVKYGIPLVGATVDFGMQKASGESTGDALIKTGAHVAIGLKAAAIGTAIGGPIGTAVGFGIGVLGSMAFDAIYDHKEEIIDGIVDTTEKASQAVGDVAGNVGAAILNLGKSLGSVFG